MDSLPTLSTSLSTAVTAPPAVTYLAYGGLLPFALLALGAGFDPEHLVFWRDSQLAYGAVILSFVGALHWAFAMSLPELSSTQATERLVWSVVPALLGWTALLLPPSLASGLLVLGFAAHYVQDRRLNSISNLPNWYLPMRLRVSCMACLCLAVSGYWSYGAISYSAAN